MFHNDDLEDLNLREELRAARSTPSEEFTSRLVHRLGADEPRRGRRVGSYRPALAIAATLSALVAAGAFGGISEAAHTVGGAVSSIVHIGHVSKPHHAVKSHAASLKSKAASSKSRAASSKSSAASSKSSTTPGSQGAFGGTDGSGTIIAPPLPPSGGPADFQYRSGCFPGFRGPFILCRWPPI